MKTSKLYIWQQPNWPHLTTNAKDVVSALLNARERQGEVIGRAASIGLSGPNDVSSEMFVQEVVATAAIEGQSLDPASVRSSVLRRLGIETALNELGSRDAEGLIDVIHDATRDFNAPLDEDRLFRWQSALFPGGTSGIRRIAVGRYRDHIDPMQIISGNPGKEMVHYTAPPSARVKSEMDAFLQWFADTSPRKRGTLQIDGIARAAIAHLWFETIHPFEDGNGRLGRAIIDMSIAQDLGSPTRLYSLSSQIVLQRKAYYIALNRAQLGTTDVSHWVQWFADTLASSCQASCQLMDDAIKKSRFWASHSQISLNGRQRKVIHRLLDDGDAGFIGGLNAEKYTKLTGASKPTATRDMADLVSHGLLVTTGQGKAMRYYVCVPGWTHGIQRTT